MTESVTITIHTAKDRYHVEGILETVQTDKDGNQTIMEVHGNIEKTEAAGMQDSCGSLERTDPTVLTVYQENEIYGFYSVHKLERKGGAIDYYGYLVGYTDGENYYST